MFWVGNGSIVNMKSNKKMLVLVILFGLVAAGNLVEGIRAVITIGSYDAYSGSFIKAGIMAFIAYMLWRKDKWGYWLAIFFAGTDLLKLIWAISLAPSIIFPVLSIQVIVPIALVLIFDLIPLILLINREVRSYFFKKYNV